MSEVSLLQKLDAVFKQFDLKEYKGSASIIAFLGSQKILFLKGEWEAIIDKLISDNYIEKNKDNGVTYKLTFDGYFFLSTVGGYVRQDELNRAENIRMETLERNQMRNQRTMTFLTWWIAGVRL